MDYSPSMSNGEEPYIGQFFVILDPPPAPKVTISKSKKKKALAAAAAAEAAAKQAAAAAAAAAAALAAAEQNGSVRASQDGYGSDGESKSVRAPSMSSVSVTDNRPKVVSNLNLPPPPPGQARNPMAEQFTRQALEQAQEDTARLSERSHSTASQHGAPARYSSFSGGMPPGQAPLSASAAYGAPPSAAAGATAASNKRSSSVSI